MNDLLPKSSSSSSSSFVVQAGAALGGFLFLRVSNMFCHNNHCTKDAPIEAVDKGLRLVSSGGSGGG